MKSLSTDQIRQLFLDYFKQQNHMIEPGAPLVPNNDPTLLWINSGVAALKKYFDGTVKPLKPRIANAQKSIRTNDIENVGLTARHHTFFEMLGNFSIGDYFKKEAIHFAWEFLTGEQWINMEKDRIYVTVHDEDTEAYRIWVEEIGFPKERILKTAHNFWQIGEGPCGPNSELFYDRGEAYDPEGLGEKLFFEDIENDRYVEVWNVVFSQYDAKDGVDRKDFQELPQKNIDTGMGLERLACIVQNVETNYDIDVFQPIMQTIKGLAKFDYVGEHRMGYRVIADHIRTVTFALGDGALFSNESRGYVLRRILRRAVRYGKKLGIEENFLYKLVPVVADAMKVFYPELLEKVDYISRLVKIEEERFNLTLADGEKLLLDVLSKTKGNVLAGETVFKLYDTYGFPFELTKEIAKEHHFNVDEDGFKQHMEEQKQRARNAREEVESMSSQSIDLMNFKTPSVFLGYQQMSAHAKVIGLFSGGKKVDVLTSEGSIIFDQTPFYAESGGQIYDIGDIYNDSCMMRVVEVKKAPNKQHLHQVKITKGTVKVGDEFTLQIDEERRQKIKANHSSVHLLHYALLEVLGSHVAQAGSFVTDSYSRFDFTHFEKITSQQLQQVEYLVNQAIFASYPVVTDIMDLESAKESGAIALFDDKYEQEVRVVTMGPSKELCGGTHAENTAQLGVYKILSEESVGSGVRRITAATQMAAYQALKNYEQTVNDVMMVVGVKQENALLNKLESLKQENADLHKELVKQRQQAMVNNAQQLIESFQEVNGLNVLVHRFDGATGDDLKQMVDKFKTQVMNDLILLSSVVNDKVIFVAHCSEAAIKQGYHAGNLVKEIAQKTGGNGGGRPDLAQAGGKDVSKVDQSIREIKEKIGYRF